MKYAGLLVMPTGFFLVLAALVLFPQAGLRGIFVVSGLVVELLGLAVAVWGHMERRHDTHPSGTDVAHEVIRR